MLRGHRSSSKTLSLKHHRAINVESDTVPFKRVLGGLREQLLSMLFVAEFVPGPFPPFWSDNRNVIGGPRWRWIDSFLLGWWFRPLVKDHKSLSLPIPLQNRNNNTWLWTAHDTINCMNNETDTSECWTSNFEAHSAWLITSHWQIAWTTLRSQIWQRQVSGLTCFAY